MKFFRLLFGALGVLLVLILVADLSKPKPQGTSSAEPKFVPAVPSARREYEAREKMQPLIDEIMNNPKYQHSSNRTEPAAAPPAQLTPAEEQAARDRYYRELLMTPSPIYEHKESPGR